MAHALGPIVDRLEGRRLMSGDPTAVQSLPFALSFGGPVAGTVGDAAGVGTGFTSVQANKAGTEYRPALVHVLAGQNQLTLTTTGTAAAGGSWEGDNTLVNGLSTAFDATAAGVAGGFTVTARLQGPLSNLTAPSEQGGIFIGPDQDNYVKLVAVSQPGGQVLQLVDEQRPAGSNAYTHAISTAASYTNIGAFSAIGTLDVQLSANPTTGVVSGAYAVNGGPLVPLAQSLTLAGAERAAFFSTTAQAGLIAMAKNNLAPVTVTFGGFGIAATAAPAPTLTGISPASAAVGSGDTTVTLTGTGFTAGSVAAANGVPLATTFVNATTLSAVLPAASLTATGDQQVTVSTPNAATTAAVVFTVTPVSTVAPTLTGVSPASAPAGSGATTITLTGTNFTAASTATANGAALATTLLSSTTLTAVIPAATLATAGTLQVAVATPNLGATTAAFTFTVTPVATAAPTLTGLSPSTVVAGAGATAVTLTGTNFLPTSVATVNGTTVATTYVSPTQVTAVVPATALAVPGTVGVTIVTPNTTTPAALPLTVTPTPTPTPAPTLTGLSPASATAGGAAVTVTLTGTNFLATSVAADNGASIATTFVNATTLTAVLPAASLAAAGTRAITVVTPNTATTPALSFTVNPVAASTPTLTGLAPSTAVAGAAATTVTLTGTNFVATSVAAANGVALATTFVSATTITAVIPAASLATAAALPITVVTPNAATTAALTFTVTPVAVTTPTLSGLTPATAAAGAAATTVTLAGTNFVAASVAAANGVALATTFVSATTLTAVIPAASLATAGTLSVTVVTPNAATTAAVAFTVTPVVVTTPTLTGLTPGTAVAGAAATTVTLAGTNFVATSVAAVNGVALATTFVNATTLTAVIPAASLAAAGTLQVTVVTPNAATTAAVAFTVTAAPVGPTPAPSPAGSVRLNGLPVGTAGSYNNAGDTFIKAVDGNVATFFNGATANGNAVGLNLGTPTQVTQVQYVPKSSAPGRMVGGVFQGSNTADFSAGVVTLFTITTAPAAGVYTAQPVTAAGAFQYVRYLSPAGSYGNVAEVLFDGVPVPPAATTSPTPAAPPAGSTALVGMAIGTPGSYGNGGNTIAKALDGNLASYYDGAAPGTAAAANWVGLNLGAAAYLTQVQYAPRSATYANRMVGGSFQASSTADFSADVVTLFTITTAPAAGVYTVQPVANAPARQYVRYLSPAGSYGNVAEVRFAGLTTVPGATTSPTAGPAPTGSAKLAGTLIGTGGALGVTGTTIAAATDGNLGTYFEATTPDGNYVGLSLANPSTVTQVQYAPRSAAYANRMVGGIFQGSNTADFSSGVTTLFTITTAPAAGVYTVQPLAATAATFLYVRYLAPAASYGDVAEVEFDGVAVVPPVVVQQPSVSSSSPTNGATDVARTAFVSLNLNLPNGGINASTLNSNSVYLYRTVDKTMVPADVSTDAAGSVIVLQPSNPLDAETSYTFVVTSNVRDKAGQKFVAYTEQFTTGSGQLTTDPNVAFSQTDLPTSAGQAYTGVVVGPDGNLYASTLGGDVFRFPINADGSLGAPTDIQTVITANGGPRLITGIAFDPKSTATNMTLWVSSGSGLYENAPDFTGKISAISGPNLSVYQDYVVGLPRSNSNHMNNQPVFGPDGALYWSQGSNSSMGGADAVWGYRPEHLLNAAILRLDITAAAARVKAGLGPINAQTDSLPAGQTAYNPYAAGAPLTLYADGVRNAYDLVWNSNGHLYAPTNGSAAGGNISATPAGVTPSAPEEKNVPVAEDDYLFDIQKGGYYGHPDPARGEYVFGGGNPVSPKPNTEIQTAYPLGTNPDPNYRGYAFDFGTHYSPDGAIQYHGSAFNGALDGAMLFTRYSGGKDIEVLKTNADGTVASSEAGITGLTGFTDPVDLTENNATGYLYVVELGGAKLTLLKPIASGATISASAGTLYFNDPVGGTAGPAQTVTLTNTGNQPLAIPATGISLSGSDGSLFVVSKLPSLPATVAPGASVSFTVAFTAGSSSLGLHAAQLKIQSNDASTPTLTLNLRALSTAGIGGNNEPSLQRILDLFQIPVTVGSADPTQTAIPGTPLTPNDEVVMQQLQKVDPESAVTVTPLAVFSGSVTPSAGFGTYTAGTPSSRVPEFYFTAADAQTVNPTAVGTTTFDPGTNPFGIYTSFDSFPNSATGTARNAYSEDLFNTYDAANTRKVRFYPLKNADGTTVPNAFIFATEDYGVSPYYDSNDVIGIIRNVRAATAGPVIGTQNVSGTADVDGAPSPTQFAFNSIAESTAETPNNVVHNTNKLRIDNSGSGPLVIGSITSSNAAFTVTTTAGAAVSYPLTVPAGSTLDLTLAYAPTHTGTNAEDAGTLTIASNDAVHPTLSLKLAGFWQQRGNILPNGKITEPSVAQLVNDVFGYKTVITNAGQNIDGKGKTAAVGEEVLSRYWARGDTNLPVTVRQLASFHTQGAAAALYWFKQGSSGTSYKIVASAGADGQSVLPYSSDSSKTPAFGTAVPSGVFGFDVDRGEYSDDALNTVVAGSGDQGHHMRFWPARDATGAVIPNTYLMAQDYQGINFDYNDNVYLISNVRPAPPPTPTNVATTATAAAGVTVTWTAVVDPLLTGYTVLRSTTKSGTYTALTATPVTGTSYVDATAVAGTTYYYTVAAVDSLGGVSATATGVAGTRPAAAAPAARPAAVVASAAGRSAVTSKVKGVAVMA